MVTQIETMTGMEPHPVWPMPPDYISDDAACEYYAVRRRLMQDELIDPLRCGYEPEIWKLADDQRQTLRAAFEVGIITEINLGGNRSSKSERAAKRVVEDCVEHPGRRWWCCDSTEAQSRMNQQRFIWKYLPVEWRNEETGSLKRTRVTKVKYSVAGGFTENCVIFPNGSEIFFKFYEMNIKNLEGPELDGCWADELIPLAWVDTLRYRLTNRNGIFHITFTPKDGWTPTVGFYRDGARPVQWIDSDPELLPSYGSRGQLLGGERVLRLEKPKDEKAIIIYFHTKDNPFGNYEGMKADVKGKSREEIKMRVYGMVDKAAHAKFPMFSEDVHVITEKQYEKLKRQNRDKETDEENGERYHLVDPCSGRNWFMLWVWCPRPLQWIVYREWPSYGHAGAYINGIGHPGEWTVAGDALDGIRGPGQRSFGFGLDRYKDEIETVEGSEQIIERWIDSRYAHSAVQEREGVTTLIEQLCEIGMDFRAMVSESRILGVQDGSIDMINTALWYDQDTPIGKFSDSLGRINEPQLLILETCPNTIYALKSWTGEDGTHGACKDPIDVLRGMFLSSVGFRGAGMYTWQR